MARYFKYHSAEDLVQEAKRLGTTIHLSDDYSVLFEPIEVGPFRVGNRLAIQPMEGCDGTLEGAPDELTFRRYQRFGSGGSKWIWGEAVAIEDEGRMNPRQLLIREKNLSAFEQMLNGCRRAHREHCETTDDFVLGIQLTHSGRYSYQKPKIVMHDPLLDPLTKNVSTKKRLDASYPLVTDDELKRLEESYVTAARFAYQVGCQFVDLKQCHRYLLSELLAATNRPGEYGGSLENRTRFIRNIVLRIREDVPQLMIVSRMNAFDGIPFRKSSNSNIGEPVPYTIPVETCFGTSYENPLEEDLKEPIQLAKWMESWGVSLINISNGNPYANPHIVRAADYPPIDGYDPPEHPLLSVLRHFRIASAIQKAVPHLPVMGSAYSWLQEFAVQAAAANISRGDVAFAGFGRATLSHPDFVNALKDDGHLNRKKICRTFSYCTNLMRTKTHPLGQYPTGCPPFDKEVYGPLWEEAKQKLQQEDDQQESNPEENDSTKP